MTPLGSAAPGETSHWPDSLSGDGRLEQMQLYDWRGGIAWLPRVTERECTKGLPRESGRNGRLTALVQTRYVASMQNCVVFRLRFERARPRSSCQGLFFQKFHGAA